MKSTIDTMGEIVERIVMGLIAVVKLTQEVIKVRLNNVVIVEV